MKILIIFGMLINICWGLSVVPGRVITPPLSLFSSLNKTLPTGEIEVSVTTYNKRGRFIKNGGRKTLSFKEYNKFLAPSLAVFEMIPKKYAGEKEEAPRGTAFHIGSNLVLTNNHVLDVSFYNTSECGKFELVDHKGEKFSCKKVHYCNPEHDVCLIEMAPKIKTKRDCFFCPGVKYEVSLAQGPALRIKASYRPPPEMWDEEILTAIGNSAGYGIHFSQGKGAFFNEQKTYFYAPITNGNSGGPLLNKEGLVIGVVKLQSLVLIGDDPMKTYNIAAPSDLVIELIKTALVNDPETLEKFLKAVVE